MGLETYNSSTALNVLGDRLTHNEWVRVKELVDKGIASVRLDNGNVTISYDWSILEQAARQIEMSFEPNEEGLSHGY